MEYEPSAWLPDSPFRSPAWRYLRALWLVERGKRAKPIFDDAGVRRIKCYLSTTSRTGPDPTCAEPEENDSTITRALRLFRDGPEELRWRLEAYLLTTEPLEAVAARCALPLATVQTYQDCFFAVRPCREASDWVWHCAIRAGSWNGFGVDYPGCVWKAFGFVAGPLALELAVAVTTGAPFPGWVREACGTNPAYEEARLRVVGKLVVAALRTNAPAGLGPLVKARQRLRRLDRQALGTVDGPDSLLPAMEGFLRWVGGRARPAPQKAAAPQTSGGRAEDRCDEAEAGRRATMDLFSESLT
jgi:hypothetical protein